MRKLIISLSIIALLFVFTMPAMAFLDYIDDDSITAEANVEAVAVVNQIGAPIPRAFPMAPEYHYPGLIGYSGPAMASSNFRSMKQIVLYSNVWKLKDLQNILIKDKLVKKHELITDKKVLAKTIRVIVSNGKAENAAVIGFGTSKSENGANSVGVFAMACVRAAKMGANAIHMNAEGVNRELKSFGWGIGLAMTRASINHDETAGSVAGGGTGIAGAKATVKDNPWLQWTALKVGK